MIVLPDAEDLTIVSSFF